MADKTEKTHEQQNHRNTPSQKSTNLRESWNDDLARILLQGHKDSAEYIDSNEKTSVKKEKKEKHPNFSLEHQIENYLMSQEFKNYFSKLNFQDQWRAIAAVIMYFIVLQDETKIIDYEDCMEFIKGNYRRSDRRIMEIISKKLWIKKWNPEYEEKMKEYIYDKIYLNWYVFHAFNSALEESIKNNWLSASIRLTPEEEIRELWLLMRKYQEPFDNYHIAWKDSERIYFDYTTYNVWDYANRSPERFWLLIHKFKLYYYGYNNMPDESIPFEYENIIKGMEKFFKAKNVTKNDKIRIKELFDKNRKLYWNWKPTLAMIKLKSVDDWINEYGNLDYETLLELAFFKINQSINRDIPIEDIKIVHFPKNFKF